MDKLNESTKKKIIEICDRFKGMKTPLVMILSDIQREFGYISLQAQEIVSEQTGISVAEIHGVVTFYSFFSLVPKGKHVVNVCLGTACYVKGSQALIDKVTEVTGAQVNGTSDDGLFSLDATRCVGACGLAPVAIIDGRVIGSCTPAMIADELKQLINAEK